MKRLYLTFFQDGQKISSGSVPEKNSVRGEILSKMFERVRLETLTKEPNILLKDVKFILEWKNDEYNQF
jgi:hypothetical protein